VAPVTPAIPSGEANAGDTRLPTGIFTPLYPKLIIENVGTDPDAT
jgi:hypothetical protein